MVRSKELNWDISSKSRKRIFEVDDKYSKSIKNKDVTAKVKKSKNKSKSAKSKGNPKNITIKDNTDSDNNSDSEDEDNSFVNTGSLIYSNENHVYFNSAINDSTIITLQKIVQKTVNDILTKSKSATSSEFIVEYPPIVLHIHSPGGSLFAAFKFIDFMQFIRNKYQQIKFHSVIEGRAASAATLISVTADKRFITKYGYMLIHQLSAGTYGKYNEIKDDVHNFDILMTRIKEIYKLHTKVPDDEIDEILRHDKYWDAKTCKRYKLVDVVIE